MGGNNQSTARSSSYRKPTTSTGLMGRGRHVQDYQKTHRVNKINGVNIGKLIVEECGNEGNHPYLNEIGRTTLRFFHAANSFIPDAEDDGANLTNTAFILRQPGREFVIISGDGDWEYDFCEDPDGQIYGRCIRKPWLRYVYDGVTGCLKRLFTAALSLVGSGVTKALKWF